MEDTHRATTKENVNEVKNVKGLNPCSNGRYSQSEVPIKNHHFIFVLILVLMEDTHRAYYFIIN